MRLMSAATLTRPGDNDVNGSDEDNDDDVNNDGDDNDNEASVSPL